MVGTEVRHREIKKPAQFTQLENGRTGIQTQGFWFRVSLSARQRLAL